MNELKRYIGWTKFYAWLGLSGVKSIKDAKMHIFKDTITDIQVIEKNGKSWVTMQVNDEIDPQFSDEMKRSVPYALDYLKRLFSTSAPRMDGAEKVIYEGYWTSDKSWKKETSEANIRMALEQEAYRYYRMKIEELETERAAVYKRIQAEEDRCEQMLKK